MRYTGPKCRLCRREGEKLFLKGDKCISQKCPLLKKNYAPGMSGAKGTFGKRSEYGRQLRNKQKAKRVYSMTEREFSRFYWLAAKQKGVTGDTLMQMLERRLDNTVYRSGIAESRSQARQFVGHGIVKLNGKKCKSPSQLVQLKDVITVNKKTKGIKAFDKLQTKKDESPKWLTADLKKGEVIVALMPGKEDFEKSIDSQLIVEYYSK